jgi:hypothetical protein
MFIRNIVLGISIVRHTYKDCSTFLWTIFAHSAQILSVRTYELSLLLYSSDNSCGITTMFQIGTAAERVLICTWGKWEMQVQKSKSNKI